MPNPVLGQASIQVDLDDDRINKQVSTLERSLEVGLTRSLSRFGQIGTYVAAALAPLVVQGGLFASSMLSAASAAATAAPLLTSIGQGAGVLAIGFQGLTDAIEDGGEALEALAPSAQTAVQSIIQLSDEWDS
ncbi:MAG TPA: hypothetical protein VHK27_03350, partial [Gammaproteobacteria bacterium]|nr:hypothetical protein [Gammaproteobacteria bacterium]